MAACASAILIAAKTVATSRFSNVVPEDKPESDWRLVDDAESPELPVNISCINLGFDTVGFELQECGDFRIKRGKVFLRPVEFEPDLIQWVYEVNLGYGRQAQRQTDQLIGPELR